MLILASQSPRRRELLHEAGYEFCVVPPLPEAEDNPQPGEDPVVLVRRLALAKARDVAQRTATGIVVGCDTVAECQGTILGKPRDASDARQMLEHLRGTRHRVVSGLCLWPRPGDDYQIGVAETWLEMTAISDAELDAYLASGQWEGKAGAFGLQDRLGWIHVVEGSESNVVGLPLELLEQMLARFQ